MDVAFPPVWIHVYREMVDGRLYLEIGESRFLMRLWPVRVEYWGREKKPKRPKVQGGEAR